MTRWPNDDDPYTFDDDLDDPATQWLTTHQPTHTTTPHNTNNPQTIHTPVDNAPEQPNHNNQTDIHPTNWQNQAACKGSTHKMFPREHKDITYIPEARNICNHCPVKPQCLDYALTFPPGDMHGVWAGLTPRQIAAEQKRRKLRPTVPTLAQMWQDLQ
jgi:WhiB family transcriptional regulator, redox-sensing transcriptional regulator